MHLIGTFCIVNVKKTSDISKAGVNLIGTFCIVNKKSKHKKGGVTTI